MIRYKRFTAAIAVLFLAVPLAAQGTTNVQTPAVPAADAAQVAAPAAIVERASMAPTFSNAAVGVRANVAVPADPITPVPQGGQGRNPAMMIVGGVALLVGAVVGGDEGTIIMIGGGILGLYGLWRYLQ